MYRENLRNKIIPKVVMKCISSCIFIHMKIFFKSLIYLCFCYLGDVHCSFGQINIPMETWRTHFNYKECLAVAQAGNHIYAISRQGMFYYDSQMQEATKLSMLDGLSENQFTALHYQASLNVLIVGYQSGMIDLVFLNSTYEPKQIVPLNFIKETTSLQGNKQINAIVTRQTTAYLSADFGLVVLDLSKQEIKETYLYLGEKGEAVGVSQTAIVADSLYISTSQGLRVAPLRSDINLQYFGNWQTLIKGQTVQTSLGNELIVGTSEGNVLRYSQGKWQTLFKLNTAIERLMPLSATLFWVLAGNVLREYNLTTQNLSVFSQALVQKPRQVWLDAQQKRWVADAQNGLLSDYAGNWRSYSPSSVDTLYQSRSDSVVSDEQGNRWVRLGAYQGILVENAKKQQTYLYAGQGAGNLPSTTVKTLALDKKGRIWVGTTAGVAVFDYPPNVFTGKNFDAYTPIYQNRRLLSNETVNTIAIDGANRKWIGTNNGLFLFGEEGTTLLNYFTPDNAPLPSKIIQYAKEASTTGEIFVRTPNGMVSYQGTALEAGDTQTDSLLIYPNPVPPHYEGVITIDKLVAQAWVKITDVAGKLLYQTQANGGRAVWNMQDQYGQKVATGIYLVLSSNADGSETIIGKIAVVR